MKVEEKGTDRHAHVNLHVEGKVKALAEYGQYIDARDSAICCYVPVEEGDKVKLGGRFSGTTMVVAYDALIDGVYRKASSYIAKAVSNQRNKKLDIESFLYNTKTGIAETSIHVAPLSGVMMTRGEGLETVGTIELRLYVTRQLGVSHALGSVEDYSKDKSNDDELAEIVIYRQVEPFFRMVLEKNCAPLEKTRSTREQTKMSARRPGTEPWAIFRFHYRSEEAIVKHGLKLTFDPKSKAKTDPHTLTLEPVPPLPEGVKPHKDDGGSSTRASSPAPPDSSPVPIKGTRKDSVSKSPTLTKQPQLAATPAALPGVSTNDKETSKTPNPTPMSHTHKDDTEALRERVFGKPSPKTPSSETATTTADKAPATGGTKSAVLSSDANPTTEKDTDIAKAALSTGKDVDKRTNGEAHGNTVATDAVENPVEKPKDREQDGLNDTIVVALPKGNHNATNNDSAAKPSSLLQASSNPANGTTTKSAFLATLITKMHPQIVIPPPNRHHGMPTPIGDTAQVTQQKVSSAIPPITPAKRTAESTDPTTPENKRQKSVTIPPLHLSPDTMSRIPPGTPSPRPAPIELKIAEQRKKLQAIRQKRFETAKKQDELDKRMEPYKKRMAEELERLNREMMEEEAAAAEDDENYKASMQMLAEFEQEGRSE